MNIFKEPLFVVLAIMIVSILLAYRITKWQEMKEEQRLKESKSRYVNDGIWE